MNPKPTLPPTEPPATDDQRPLRVHVAELLRAQASVLEAAAHTVVMAAKALEAEAAADKLDGTERWYPPETGGQP